MAGETDPRLLKLRVREPEVEQQPPDQAGGELAEHLQVEAFEPTRGFSSRPMKKSYRWLPVFPALREHLLFPKGAEKERKGEREGERDAGGE
jgi:hypothetical protein